jgi:Protein of unknown function (DUF2997)
MRSSVIIFPIVFTSVHSFLSPPSFIRAGSESKQSSDSNLETLEFRIFPDGRVEEVVRGVKGMNCNQVTEDINSVLGKVVATEPTEELYQQDLTLSNEVKISDGNWDGMSSW